eukprot:1155313-Rhodomonas_salina.1
MSVPAYARAAPHVSERSRSVIAAHVIAARAHSTCLLLVLLVDLPFLPPIVSKLLPAYDHAAAPDAMSVPHSP